MGGAPVSGFWPRSREPKSSLLSQPQSLCPVRPSPAAPANPKSHPGSAAPPPHLGPACLLPNTGNACPPEGSLKPVPASSFVLLLSPSSWSPFSNTVVLRRWPQDQQRQQHPGRGMRPANSPGLLAERLGGFPQAPPHPPGDSETLRIGNRCVQRTLPAASRAFFLKPRLRPHILLLGNSR